MGGWTYRAQSTNDIHTYHQLMGHDCCLWARWMKHKSLLRQSFSYQHMSTLPPWPTQPPIQWVH